MATSSIRKSFSLSTAEQTDIFMQKFEEHLRNPQKEAKSNIPTATENDVEKMISRWKKSTSAKKIRFYCQMAEIVNNFP